MKKGAMRKTIGLIAKELLESHKFECIDLGSYGLLDEIYRRAFAAGIIKTERRHPLDWQAYIIRQLRKSKFFERKGYAEYKGMGRSFANCVVLKLKEKV